MNDLVVRVALGSGANFLQRHWEDWLVRDSWKQVILVRRF